MLAMDLAHEDRLVALMDIGTNTELIVGNRHRIAGGLVSGRPGVRRRRHRVRHAGTGWRDRRRRVRDDGTFHVGVIGGGDREGICGSGLVELMSELLRAGRMNAMGRFEDGEDRITLDADRGLVFLERDVNELAQAKGANVAGLHVVFSRYGIHVRRPRGVLPRGRLRPVT